MGISSALLLLAMCYYMMFFYLPFQAAKNAFYGTFQDFEFLHMHYIIPYLLFQPFSTLNLKIWICSFTE